MFPVLRIVLPEVRLNEVATVKSVVLLRVKEPVVPISRVRFARAKAPESKPAGIVQFCADAGLNEIVQLPPVAVITPVVLVSGEALVEVILNVPVLVTFIWAVVLLKFIVPPAPVISSVPLLTATAVPLLLMAPERVKVLATVIVPVDQVDAPVTARLLLAATDKLPVVMVKVVMLRLTLPPKVTSCPPVALTITVVGPDAGHSLAVVVKAPVLVYLRVGVPVYVTALDPPTVVRLPPI
jgi:hypothetical protein